jgi:hypothetical protein
MKELEGGEYCLTRSYVICILPIEENEVGGTCSTNGIEEKYE